jgi:hypothetical protein
LQRSRREPSFPSNCGKRSTVLKVSAQKFKTLKRTLTRRLGEASQFIHLESLLARTRKIITQITAKCQFPNYLASSFPRYLARDA